MKTHSQPAASCVDDIVITAELERRPRRAPDYAAENEAMAALARQLAADPHGVPQKLAELVMGLCSAGSAGISLLEEQGTRRVFRWHAAAGRVANVLGGTMDFASSPCGVVVERNETVLMHDGGRWFPALAGSDPPMIENLLVPWKADGRAIGTVWVISHDPERRFDAEDARVLRNLADFAAAAYQSIVVLEEMVESRRELVRAAEERTSVLAGHNRMLENEIAQRRRAEDALRASEQRYRTLADTVPVLIWQNDEAGRNVFVNRYYLDFTGRAAPDVLGMRWHELVHPDDAPGYIADYMDAVRARRPWRNMDRVLRRDGQWRWFDNYAQPLFAPDGSYVGHVGASLDITDAVLAEQALKETDRRKDEFLAVLAHELRNPLAPISNAVHLLRHPDGRRRADRLVEMLGRQVRHMIKLVDDLLEISRITRDKIELHLQPLLLADVVHGAVETSRPLIDQNRHHLDVRLPHEPLTLHADSVRLTQVLANLLNNAAKYTDQGGHIELSARRDGDDVEIAVRDNGIGIPPGHLPEVFDMFTQAHRAAGRGQGGLGIGLAMVRSLVQMHGGSVQAQSAGAGQGSEFIVRLPLAATPHAAHAAQTGAQAAPLAGQRILVVDDNRDAADTLAMLLEADGAEARAVYDGETALAVLPALRPHAVLLDLGMLDMDGFEVARRIRADPTLSGVRIVALTGWGQESDRQRTRGAGFDFHLTKPVDLAMLHAWLGQARSGTGA